MSEASAKVRVGVTSDRLARVTPEARAMHHRILLWFAANGRAPTTVELEGSAHGPGVGAMLRELHDMDVVRLDDDGGIRAAYPFSAVPTAHTVAIDDGPTVYAMCAIDALGMAEMLDRNVTITSADPFSGGPIIVGIHNGRTTWTPDGAVVFVGSDAESCCDAAADRCCGVMNFFASAGSATAWLRGYPQVNGDILTGQQAYRLGVDIFGRLLS